MQGNKINILSTRPLNKALVTEARSMGIGIDELSFIETGPVQDLATQQKIEQAYLRSSTVVFTSVNAVDAVIAQQRGQQPDWAIYCMGNSTRQLLEKHFSKHNISGSANNATGLAELIVEESAAAEVTFFCAGQRRDELPAILHNNGIDVQEVIVYQTFHTPHKINSTHEAILFYSPSAVHSFFSNNRIAGQTILFAIGTTTAETVQQYCSNTIIIGKEPDKEKLAKQAMEFFTNRRMVNCE